MPEQVELGPKLASLVKYCETVCVADCCGLDAFDFDPVHVASLLLSFNQQARTFHCEQLEKELVALESVGDATEPGSEVKVCSIELLNASFTRASLFDWTRDIRRAIANAHRILDFRNKLD